MALTPKTGQEIIDEFGLQNGDTTDLSTSESIMVLNRVYRSVLDSKDWLFLMKPINLTTDGTDRVALPEDFKKFVASGQYTERFLDSKFPFVIFLGENKRPYYYVNYLDREQYSNTSGFFYIDINTNEIVFTQSPDGGQTVKGDYIYTPDDVTTVTSPVFPSEYSNVLVYGMAVDDLIIQLFDKAKSYAPENQVKYRKRLAEMKSWNDSFIHI
jgi:hypothetical protein